MAPSAPFDALVEQPSRRPGGSQPDPGQALAGVVGKYIYSRPIGQLPTWVTRSGAGTGAKYSGDRRLTGALYWEKPGAKRKGEAERGT
jgi:hypothetical protein